MKEWIMNLYSNLETFILSIGYYGIFVSTIIIVFESIIPIIPVGVFFALNCMILGKIPGLIFSYIETIIGCMLSFLLVNNFLKDRFTRILNKSKNGKKVINFVNGANLTSLAVIMAIPFAPAFLINVAAGLSDKVNRKTFLIALLIGKVFLIYFWGFIGVSLKDSISNPIVLLKIGIMIVIAYLASNIVNKKLGVK